VRKPGGAVFILPQAAAFIGWDVAAAAFLVLVWSVIWGLGPDSTQHRATQLDPSTGLAEQLVTAAGGAVILAMVINVVPSLL
jgi:uncharacterized membrane protein